MRLSLTPKVDHLCLWRQKWTRLSHYQRPRQGSPGSRGEELALNMATHGKPMSRLQRSIDAPHRRLLSKLEEKWSLEEDRAMIKNKCCSHPEL